MDCIYPKAYAAYNNNLDVRLKSTSGGIFTVIAEYLIKEKRAVIYGASFDTKFDVAHIRIENIEQLSKLRGSKYPQSKIGDCYKRAKVDLENKLTVLFVGTPCQIVGLKNYLGKEYDNLYCMDFVCHGVASNKVWQDYVKTIEKKGKICSIVFKYKYRGWKNWYFRVNYVEGHHWQRRGYLSKFMHSYLSYINIRPSCFECRFKGLKHCSDFTISDCWGIAEKDREINDNNGLSALLIQNNRAMSIFENIAVSITFKEYDAYLLMEGNWTAFRSVPRFVSREKFFRCVSEKNGYKALCKYFTPGLKMWVRYYIQRIRGLER